MPPFGHTGSTAGLGFDGTPGLLDHVAESVPVSEAGIYIRNHYTMTQPPPQSVPSPMAHTMAHISHGVYSPMPQNEAHYDVQSLHAHHLHPGPMPMAPQQYRDLSFASSPHSPTPFRSRNSSTTTWSMPSPISAAASPMGHSPFERYTPDGSWPTYHFADHGSYPYPAAAQRLSTPYVQLAPPPNQPKAPPPLPLAQPTHSIATNPDNTSSRLRISNLLNEPPSETHPQRTPPPVPAPAPPDPPPPPKYRLTVRQPPTAARACGFGERDRRTIDPPPILQLTLDDPQSDGAALLAQPNFVVHCSLRAADGLLSRAEMPPEYAHCRTQAQSRLTGSLAVSPFLSPDEHGVVGTFFPFADLSVRTPGRFTLFFSLHQIVPGQRAPRLAQVVSDVFVVFNAKEFPGMQASTPLTAALRAQGCHLGIKQGTEKRVGRGRTKAAVAGASGGGGGSDGGGGDGDGDGENQDVESDDEVSGATTTKRQRLTSG